MQPPAALAPLVDLIFPPRCPLCGEGLASQTGLCQACWGELELLGEPAAGDPVTAAVRYNDTSRDLVLAFKTGRKIALAPLLARLMSARLGPFGEGWTALPVPLHRTRLWHRGFNQSAMLAREISKLTGCGLLLDGLVRRKRTPPLGGLGAADRRKVLDGAIAANSMRAAQLRGAKVLLIDDVYTSGATTGACLEALRAAGVGKIRIACFARVTADDA